MRPTFWPPHRAQRRRLLLAAVLVPVAAQAARDAAVPGASAASATRTAPDHGALIDVAGRQRMLSQRIVKAYCQIGLQAAPEIARAQLGEAVARFDAQFAELRRKAPNATVRAALARVTTPWQRFRRQAAGAVTRDGARRLSALGEEVLAAAHAVVVELQDSAGTPQARLVNISGRERMLSQRLAKLYMLRAWGLDTPSLRDQMDTAAHEFDGALGALRAAPANTTAIAVELEEVALQWEWFKAALELQGAESYVYVVADASESILQHLERITANYAGLTRG